MAVNAWGGVVMMIVDVIHLALGSWVCTTMRVHVDHALEWVYCMGYLHGSGGAAHTYRLPGALMIFLLAKAIRKNTFKLNTSSTFN